MLFEEGVAWDPCIIAARPRESAASLSHVLNREETSLNAVMNEPAIIPSLPISTLARDYMPTFVPQS